MADSALRKKGREMRRKLLGNATVERIDKTVYTDPIMRKFGELTQETIFGALWTRPGLDLKTRTLICVISDAATGRDPELKLHLRQHRDGALHEPAILSLVAAHGFAASSLSAYGAGDGRFLDYKAILTTVDETSSHRLIETLTNDPRFIEFGLAPLE